MEVSKKLQALLTPKTRVAVLTGAGVSQESGVPTFRDKDGLWQKFKPEELASMNAFLANPTLVWDWYEHRRKIIREVQANDGHRALVAMENYFTEFTLATQNVDGLHSLAGQKTVLELHGNILRSFCLKCGKFANEKWLEAIAAPADAQCQHCRGLLRPDVVWFGENLPMNIFAQAERAAQNCDLFFSVGTSGAVFPAAGLPLIARECGAYVVEVNPKETEITHYFHEVLLGPSAQILPHLVKLSAAPSAK